MVSSPSPVKNAVALTAVCLAALMFGLEISSIPVILPTLEHVLGSSFQDLQWIMNAYTIACTTVLMAAGTLADRYGRKRIFLTCLLLFGASSLLCGLADSSLWLIIGRFLQGMAGGAMLVCQLVVLSHQFSNDVQRAKAFGIWGIVFGLGLGFGPIIGAGIVAVSNWQWVFLIHVPLAVIASGLLFASVNESRNPQAGRLNFVGIIALSVAVFALAWFITQGSLTGFTSAAGLTSAAIAIGSVIVFVVVEQRSSDPTFDFSVFGISRFSGALLGSVGMNFSFWPFMIYLPLYFQNRLGYDNVATGLSLLAYTLPTLLLPPIGERLALRYRAEVVIPVGLFVIGVGFLLMMWGNGLSDASWLTMLPGCLLAGVGLGITNTPVTNTTTGSVSHARTGMASGIDTSARLITLAINIPVMGYLLAEGVFASLQERLAATSGSADLRLLSERFAAGAAQLAENPLVPHIAPDTIRQALAHGFGNVMLYGALSVWLLALGSAIVFRLRGVDTEGEESAVEIGVR